MIDALVKEILAHASMVDPAIETVKSSEDEQVLFVNDGFVLRVTKSAIQNQVDRLNRIENLDLVPKLLSYGISFLGSDYSYCICDKLRGKDYIDAILGMSEIQNRALGTGIAGFLDSLHAIKGAYYDIGHYIPILPKYEGTWKSGHLAYWDYIKRKIEELNLGGEYAELYKEAFAYLQSHADALCYEQGSVLLHNDLHPKNIIVDKGGLSGVIDWECSQYGEPDFDYCHFIHWCQYPPEKGMDLKPFLHAIIEASAECARVPRLGERLTMYQIEHELMQIVWSEGSAQGARAPKLEHWLGGGVERLLA